MRPKMFVDSENKGVILQTAFENRPRKKPQKRQETSARYFSILISFPESLYQTFDMNP